MKNKICEEKNKNNNLYYEIKKNNCFNSKLLFDNQKIVNENYVLKIECDEKENIIKKYQDKEIEINREKEIIQDMMDLIKRSRINDENERKELLDENEDLKNLNQKLKDEKNKLILDLQYKNLIINNYENDLENIDENIEEIKNKMKKIENLTFLTKGFQLYLSQRIDKKKIKLKIYFYIYLHLPWK